MVAIQSMAGQECKVNRKRNDYTRHAVNYENDRFQGRVNEYLEMLRRRAVLSLLSACAQDSRVLDIGCGTGRGLFYLASDGFSSLTGIDYTGAMLDIARQHVGKQGLHDSIRLIRGDAFSLPWRDKTFDVVMSLNFLHMFNFDLQQALVQEMTRVCGARGLIVIELESIHKGLFVTRCFEQRRLRHRTKFNSFWEVQDLFPATRFENVKVYGAALPVLYRILSRTPRLGGLVESITHSPPFNWLSERVLVGVRKRR